MEQSILEKEGESVASRVESCEIWYSDKDYRNLYRTLKLWKTEEPDFDVYHELMDGYWDYLHYQAYSKIEESSMVEDVAGNQQYYEKKLMDNAKNCKDSRNQHILDKFTESIP